MLGLPGPRPTQPGVPRQGRDGPTDERTPTGSGTAFNVCAATLVDHRDHFGSRNTLPEGRTDGQTDRHFTDNV